MFLNCLNFTEFLFFSFCCRSICIIDDGASRRRTRNTRYRVRILISFYYRRICITNKGASRRLTRNAFFFIIEVYASETLVTALTTYLFFLISFYYRSICIIDNGASKRRTRNARFRARCADHSTTSMLLDLIGAAVYVCPECRTMNIY